MHTTAEQILTKSVLIQMQVGGIHEILAWMASVVLTHFSFCTVFLCFLHVTINAVAIITITKHTTTPAVTDEATTGMWAVVAVDGEVTTSTWLEAVVCVDSGDSMGVGEGLSQALRKNLSSESTGTRRNWIEDKSRSDFFACAFLNCHHYNG